MEAMRYVKSEKYNTPALQAKIMKFEPHQAGGGAAAVDARAAGLYARRGLLEGIVSQCRGAEVLSMREMESNDEVWADWLAQDNEYAVGDRKSMEAGGGKYLNFIAIVLRKKKNKRSTSRVLLFAFRLSKKACHCEPVRRLAWQSVLKTHDFCALA